MGITFTSFILLFFQSALTSSGFVTAQICPYPDGIYVVQEDCTSFLRCEGGNSQIVPCPRNLSFNPHKLTCDYSTKGYCNTKTESLDHQGKALTTSEYNCPDEGTSIQPCSNSCSEYYRCVNGTAYKERCPDGLLMNKQILTCDFADEVPCDHFRQRKLLQDGDNYDYNLEVDNPQDVATVSSVSEGEEPNVDPEGGDSVNAGGSEYESLDNLEKNDVNVEEKEDVSENPENSDSVNGVQNEEVDFTDILLPTATSPKTTYETTSEALSVTTKMQSSETKLSNNKAVEDDVNVLLTISVANKSDNPSSQPEKKSVSSTLSYDKTFEYSPNPSPTTSTTIAIQVATKVTDSLFSQQELQHSTAMKPNINNQTNKSTTENNLLFDNAVSGNKLASTKQDETKSSSVTSEEFKTEAKAINTTYPPNNTQDSSEHVQTKYTTKSIIITQTYTNEVPNDKVSNSLNANDESYDIVSDAETTSEALTKRTTNLSTEASVFFTSYTESNATLNTTTKSLSNTTSDSVFYSTANPTTVSTTTFNSTTKSFTGSDAHKVNIITEKSAESISTASSLKNASEIKELSNSVTEQNRIPTNEYKSNSDILQGTTTIHTNISSATTHSSDETSSFKLENSSQKLDTETISNEEVNSTYAEDANETMGAFTTESLQQTTLEYKNSTIVDFLVSSTTTTSNATTESNYVNLENKTSPENRATERSSATKPSTDQKFNDIATSSYYSMSDKLSASVVTPVTTNIELTGFTTATNEEEPTTTTTVSQEKKTEASKDIGYSSRADEMKVESNSTTPERQLSSEIIAVTDKQTSSFATTMINEQTTGMEKTVIGEQTNDMVLSTNKYQNDNAETTISELMVSVESTTADNEASNLITNVTNYQTSHEVKSDVPTTPSKPDEMKIESNNTTSERQLSSEIIAVTDKHTTSFATTMIDEQTTDVEKIIGEQTKSMEISTNKYQNDSVETTKSEQKISVVSTTADSEASNLTINVTNYQTSYELKSDVPTTPLTEQKDSVSTTMIEGKTNRMETTKIYEQTTGIKNGINEQENGTEISTYDTQKNYEKTNMLELKSVGTTPKISQGSSMETGADNTQTNNLDASTVNELTSDDQTTPTVEQNDSIATLLIDDQTIHVETTTTYESTIDENLSSVDATSIGENHSEVLTSKNMEYFSTEATTTTDEYTMSASSTTTEQQLPNEETTETEKQSNDVTIASVKDFASSVMTTGTYIWDSSSDVMTEKEASIMDATTIEEIPLNVSSSKTDDHSNITDTLSDKEHAIIFETTVTEYLPNMTGVTTEKDTDAMATLTTYEQLIPIYKTTEGTTKQKISSADPNIETTSVEKLSTVSYTAIEKLQTADEKISDEQKEEVLSSVSTRIVDEELSTVEVTETDKELMSAPSTTEKDQITTKSDTKERLTTLPTRNEDVTDIKTLTTVEKRGTIVTSKTGDYLSNVVTATANNIGITGIEDETENDTELPTEIEQMNSSITTEDLSSLPVSTIEEQPDDLVTATIDQGMSSLGAFTMMDQLAPVTTPLITAVTTEKYVSSINTITDDKYTTNDENTFKTEKFSTYVGSSSSKDSTESIVTTKDLSNESTTETDELLKNDDVTTSNEYLRPIITSTSEKTFNIVVTSTTEKPFINTDNFPTDDDASNKDTLMTEKDFITLETVAFFTDIDNSTTEQYPLTAEKESSSLKSKEFNENPSATKTEIQNDSNSIDSTTIEWHSNNLSSPTRENTNILPLTTTENQQSSLSEVTDVEELSGLKTLANTEEPRNTEPAANNFSPYTTMAENELKTVTAAVVEETSFFTAEKYPRGLENVTTVEYLTDNYTSTRQKYPSGDDSTTMKGSPTSIDSITSAEYPSSANPTTMKENPTSINTITSSEYLIITDPTTTKENPTSIDSITSVEYPSSATPTTTEEEPTNIDTHTTAEYPSRKNTIFTEKYPSSINSATTTTHRNATDSITTLSNVNDVDTDEYFGNIDTITTEKYANINYVSTEENSSGFYSTITEKYSSNLDMITTDEYPNRPMTVEIHTSTIDSNTSEEYVSSSTKIDGNNNSEVSSETEEHSSGTFPSIISKDPSNVKSTAEDREPKYITITTVDKYPTTVNFTTIQEHLSSVDVTTETYRSNITTTGTENDTHSYIRITNMVSTFTETSPTARDQLSTMHPFTKEELNNEITTTEENLRITDTSTTEEQPIDIDTITTTKYPLNVITTEKHRSSVRATTLEEDLISGVVSTDTQEMLINNTFATELPNSLSTSTEQQRNRSGITVTEEELKEVSTTLESTSNSITESTLTSVPPRESRIENSTMFDYSSSNKVYSTSTRPTTKPVFPDDQVANYCNGEDGIFPDNENCSMFVRCFNGSPYFQSCPEGLYYNPTKRSCDFDGECGSEPLVPSSRSLAINCGCENCIYPDADDCARYYVCLNGSAYDMQCNDGLQFNAETLTCDYEEQASCAKSSEECPTPNGYIQDADNCSRYFHCVGGIAYRKTCEDGQHFNEVTEQCDDPCSAGCDSYACMKASTLLPSPVCEDGDKFYPHPENCNAFYTCFNGRAELAFCTDDEHFSPTTRMCQEPCEALCDHSLDCVKTSEGVTESTTEMITAKTDASTYVESTTNFVFTSPILQTTEDETTEESSTSERYLSNDTSTNAVSLTSEVVTTETTFGMTSDIPSEYPLTHSTELNSVEPTTPSVCGTTDGFYPKPGDCSSFINCTSGIPTEQKCDSQLHFSPRTLRCEYPCFAECDPSLDCSSTEVPDQLFNLCPKKDILPGRECNRYINCTGEKPFTRKCPIGLHFNPTTRVCDWPTSAGCGKSSSYPDVDNYYKCPCETCIIPSMESCAKYHLCIGYVAYTAKCSDGLLLDNILNTCNRASKVKCEEGTKQPTTTPLPSSTVSTTEKATTAAETFKCSTKDGYFQKSDDCGKFIQCANWRPYVMKCPSMLHFSMKTLRCEYPCDAKCDLSLACSNASKSGTADKICACLNCKVKDPESCTNYFECKNGKARRLFCRRGQTFDSERGFCDWAHKVKCHSQTCPKMNGLFPHRDNCRKFLHCANGIPYINECHNNWEFDPVALRCSWPSGRCGSTTPQPSTLKPRTKSLKDFDCLKNFGVFRDEENCTRFYHCSHGIAFAKECPEGLAFNPKSQTCDWKKNVKCDSDRYYHQRRCRVYDRHTTCPQSRVNIRHSNCDMFYECSTGSACGKRCPVGLYFNSTTAVCDRPENVQCYKDKNEVYSLRDFAKACYETGEGYMNDPAMSHCFYRCHHEKVVRGCCPRNAVYNEKKDKCEIQRRKLFF